MAESEEERPKRAFIYCRTSEDSEQEDGKKVSIETQIESGEELARRHNYQVVDTFIDRNRSGRLYPTGFSISDSEVETYCNECGFSAGNRTRNGLGKLLERLSEVDIIILRRADRLMRPLPLSKLDAHILGMIKSAGVLIHSQDDNILDPNNEEHILVFKISSTIQSKYVSERREETRIGIRKKRDSGQIYASSNFYGFRSAGVQKVRRIPEEIKIVKRIYRDYLDGKGFAQVARELNQEGVLTFRRNRLLEKGEKFNPNRDFWVDSTVRDILDRPQYAGFQLKSNEVEEVKVPAYHPPVIPYKTWKRVEAKRNETRGVHVGNRKRVHPLAGLLRCGCCGYNLCSSSITKTLDNGRQIKFESFRCNKDRQVGGVFGCGTVSIRERVPPEQEQKPGQFYAKGLEECLYPLIYKGYIDHLIAKHRREGLDDEIAECMIQISDNKRFQKKLAEKLSTGVITDDVFDSLIGDYIEKERALNEKLDGLKAEAVSIDRVEVPSTTFEGYETHNISDKLKRELFHQAIERIDVWKKKITVHLKPEGSFTLKRIHRQNCWDLPGWRIIESNMDSVVVRLDDNGIQHIDHNKMPISVETKIDVLYQYANADPLSIAYGDQNILIGVEGKSTLDGS